jgi:hypothetical protein
MPVQRTPLRRAASLGAADRVARSYLKNDPWSGTFLFNQRYFLDEPSFTLQQFYDKRSIRRLGWGAQWPL